MLRVRRIGPQINDQARNTNSQSYNRVSQRHDRGDCKKAQRRDRPQTHDPARAGQNLIRRGSVDELANQQHVGRVHQKEDRRIEGNRANSLTAIQAVESGSSDMENKCAKLNHNRRGVASVA